MKLNRTFSTIRWLLHVMTIFSLAIALVFSSGIKPVAAQNAFIEASSSGHWVHGRGWPIDTVLNMTLTGPEINGTYSASATVGQSPWNPNDIVADFSLPDDIQIRAGQTIIMTGGGESKTLVVSPLQVTGFNLGSDVVSGTTNPGATVTVCANVPNNCYSRNVTSGADGSWTANYGLSGTPPEAPEIYNVQPGSNGWAMEMDTDGDQTWTDWRVPNPGIETSLTYHWIQGREWANGATISMTIQGMGADYSTTAVFGEAPWNPNDHVAIFDLPSSLVLEAGQTITMSGEAGYGEVTKTLLIPDLQVTGFDLTGDAVTGYSDQSGQVQVCANVPDNCYSRYVTPDANGNWTAVYNTPGSWPDSPDTFDVKPGSDGWAAQQDEDGDRAQIGWRVLNPYIEASPYSKWLHAREWPKGTDVAVTVSDGQNELYNGTAKMEQAPSNPGDPNDIVANFQLPDTLNLAAGQTITASGQTTFGLATKTLVISPLKVTGYDVAGDKISGVASDGLALEVCVNQPNYCMRRQPIVSGGTWNADYSVAVGQDDSSQPYNLQPGDNGWAAQYDADGDRTWYDWRAPNPHFNVRPDTDSVDISDWPLGNHLTLTTRGMTFTATVGVASWNPSETYANISLRGLVDIVPGDFLSLTDGDTTKTTTVTELKITGVNEDYDTVSGTAAAGSTVDLWTCGPNNCANRRVTADGNGQWTAFFAFPGPRDFEQITWDIVPGINGDSSQEDEDGDRTQMNWRMAGPNINASYEFDWIGANYFTPNGQITYSIYDEQNNLQFGPVTGPLDPYGNGWISSQLTHTDLAPGYRVVAKDETTGIVRELLIRKITFERLDDLNDVVYGKADPGVSATVHISGYHYNDPNIDVPVTADSSGNWQLDLRAMGYDVQNYWWANVDVCDSENNCVTAEAPKIQGTVRNNWFNADNFSKNADVTLQIFDGKGGASLLGPITLHTNRTGQAGVNLNDYNFKLAVGQDVVVTDTLGWSKDLVIGPVIFDSLNASADVTSGTAEPGGQLSIHVNSLFANWSDRLAADSTGHWSYDYGARGYDLTPNMWGNIWLQDNNMDFTQDFTTGMPNLNASAQYDWVGGWNFSPNGQVRLQIYAADNSLVKDATFTADGGSNLWVDSNSLGVDLTPQIKIVATDLISGNSTELTLVYLTFDAVDYITSVASGKADPGARVVVQAGAQFENYELAVMTGNDGVWTADFSTKGVTLREDMWINAHIYDAVGNGTQADAPKPPVISASVQDNWVSGNNWPPDSDVTITINTAQATSQRMGVMALLAAAEAQSGTITITVHTDQYGSFFVNLSDYNVSLKSGDTVAVSDANGTQVKEEQIIALAITQVDYNQNIVHGTAPAGTRVTVGFGNKQGYLEFDVFADSNGNWLANFGLHDFDLTPDMNGSLRASDNDGDTTQININPPTFAVWYAEDYVEGWNWINGSEVTLTVDDPATPGIDYTNTATASPLQGKENVIAARFPTGDPISHPQGKVIDIQPGFTLTMSDGNAAKTTVVTRLALNENSVNVDTNTLSGTAEGSPGVVHGFACWNSGCLNKDVQTSQDGAWLLDFSSDDNFQDGTGGGVWQDDPDGDSTQLRWWTPFLPPVATAGPDQTINEGETAYLDGTNSEPMKTSLVYTWDLDNDGKYDDAYGAKTSVTFDDNGVHPVSLKVTNQGGLSSTTTVNVTVNNIAPKNTTITGPLDPKPIGSSITLNANFYDPGVIDTFTSIWAWGDGTTSSGAVDGRNVTGSHTYTTPGVYQVRLSITDKDGGTSSSTYEYVVIYDPSGGFVTGGGWILSPVGAYDKDPAMTGKATFGFEAKYKKGVTVPTGDTQFIFHNAGFTFESTAYEWLVITGSKAQYKGTGTVNGIGKYGFILTAIDGNSDRFRIKIWDIGNGKVIYDNKRGSADNADDATTLGGGSITIHKDK